MIYDAHYGYVEGFKIELCRDKGGRGEFVVWCNQTFLIFIGP